MVEVGKAGGESSPRRSKKTYSLRGRTVVKKVLSLCVAGILTVTVYIHAGFAGNAMVLSDAELDTVYAEGFLVDFGLPDGDIDLPGAISGDQTANLAANMGVNQESSGNVSIGGSIPGNGINGTLPIQGITPIQMDLILDKDQNGNVGLTLDSPLPDIPGTYLPGGYNILPSGNSGTNIVIVDDLAQQNLSSFVNVNSAGSIVPVMINIIININSTVENVSGTNNLDFSNYYRFNVAQE